jgi:Bacterial PH domain
MPYVMAAVVDVTLVAVTVSVSGAKTFDRVAFLGCAVVATVAIHRLADVRAVATAEGLTVVNWARRRRLGWVEIVGVRLAPGDPWLQLDVSDGTTLAVMAIQAADGARAKALALEVAAAVTTYGSADATPGTT